MYIRVYICPKVQYNLYINQYLSSNGDVPSATTDSTYAVVIVPHEENDYTFLVCLSRESLDATIAIDSMRSSVLGTCFA